MKLDTRLGWMRNRRGPCSATKSGRALENGVEARHAGRDEKSAEDGED